MGRIVSSLVADLAPRLRVRFGGAVSRLDESDGLALQLAIPCLKGASERTIPLSGGGPRTVGRFKVWEDAEGRAWGACLVPWANGERDAMAREAYLELLKLNRDRHLHRLWNFVPQINEFSNEEENYRRFCIGRSEAFVAHFGAEAKAHMPAASAVGIQGTELVMAFLAGRQAATHFENPRQVPAYEYPREHGRRPPSFARGTVVNHAHYRDVFISGTAAVRGHLSAARGDLDGQVATTLEMLASLGSAMDIGADLGASAAEERQFVVYLRHGADLPRIQAQLAQSLFVPTDVVTYLQTDICRAELLLEIEGSARIFQEREGRAAV